MGDDVVLGDAVKDDIGEREFFSQDIWAKGQTADFVASPKSVEELQAVVKTAYQKGIPLNPRGGGMSYTRGFTPDRAGVGILDMSKMDRVVEINVDDMYVTVEAGITWKALFDALKPYGVRTPFWGPLSGLTSTVGGGISQNNALLGAAKYGISARSVLSLTVILADGSILKTGGSAGTRGGKPFIRYYGPDLTGLFCGDCGALGHKAEVTLRLIPLPTAEETASFEFADRDSCAQAISKMLRENIATDLFGFDPNLARVRMARTELLSDAKALTNVIKNQGSLLKGLKEGAKVAMAGRGFMKDANYTVHVAVEGRSEVGVKDEVKILKDIVAQTGGREIENSIPKIVRANPFGPLTSILGPRGERWAPVHGMVPLSEGQSTWAELDEVFAAFEKEFDAHDILHGYLTTGLGNSVFTLEPVFLWPDEIWPIHEHTVGKDMAKKVARHAQNAEALDVVHRARKAIIDVFEKKGAAHLQIGRTYPYKETREPTQWGLLEAIKAHADPNGLINPGALGF